jgi:hypothetical protein
MSGKPAGMAHPGAQAASSARALPPRPAPRPAAKPAPLLDLNRASAAELAKLPGLSADDAQRIVAGRPYLSKTDLATRHILPTGVYLAIRRSVVALPTGPVTGRPGDAVSKRARSAAQAASRPALPSSTPSTP